MGKDQDRNSRKLYVKEKKKHMRMSKEHFLTLIHINSNSSNAPCTFNWICWLVLLFYCPAWCLHLVIQSHKVKPWPLWNWWSSITYWMLSVIFPWPRLLQSDNWKNWSRYAQFCLVWLHLKYTYSFTLSSSWTTWFPPIEVNSKLEISSLAYTLYWPASTIFILALRISPKSIMRHTLWRDVNWH